MAGYRRNCIAGGKFFFTLTLADRRSTALVDHVGVLRAAFRVTRQERPFAIDAIEERSNFRHGLTLLL
jgi:putative transposase